MNRQTTEEFYKKFTPIKNHLRAEAAFDGCMFETFGKEKDFVVETAQKTQRKIWTITYDDGDFYFVAGLWHVDRVGFLITEECWDNDELKDNYLYG